MVSVKRRMVAALALGLGSLALMTVAQPGNATHPRPVSAPSIQVSFVPAYDQCTSSNRTHGPPLEHPSCNPPAQTSDYLTVGTFDANGAAAKSVAYGRVKVIPPSCCPHQDVQVSASISDVRCKPATTACSNANAAGGRDYTGDLQINSTIRITDHNNAVAPGGGTDPATVVDVPFPISMSCAATADTSIGSRCDVTSSAVGVGPPQGGEPGRAVVGISQFEVLDGGADGFLGTTPNTRFAAQGIFIP